MIRSKRGFTLIEVLVAVSILSIVSLGLATVISQLSQRLVTADRKLESMELRASISRVLSDPTICACILNTYADPVDTTNLNIEPHVSEIRSTCSPSSSLVVREGEDVPETRTQLRVSQVRIAEIEAAGAPNQFVGKIYVDLDIPGIGMKPRPIDVAGQFTTRAADPANARQIESCIFSGVTSLTAALPNGSCASGEYVKGISAAGVICEPLPSPVIVAAAGGGSPSGLPSLLNPGRGCEGMNCVTHDYGPCDGMKCKTNGLFCKGMKCIASAPGASCDGSGCCAGPQCIE